MGWLSRAWGGLKKGAEIGSLIPGVNAVAGPLAAGMNLAQAGKNISQGNWKGALGSTLRGLPGAASIPGVGGRLGGIGGALRGLPGAGMVGKAAGAYKNLPGWGRELGGLAGVAGLGALASRAGGNRAGALRQNMGGPTQGRLRGLHGQQFAGGGWIYPGMDGGGVITTLGDTPSGEEFVIPESKYMEYMRRLQDERDNERAVQDSAWAEALQDTPSFQGGAYAAQLPRFAGGAMAPASLQPKELPPVDFGLRRSMYDDAGVIRGFVPGPLETEIALPRPQPIAASQWPPSREEEEATGWRGFLKKYGPELLIGGGMLGGSLFGGDKFRVNRPNRRFPTRAAAGAIVDTNGSPLDVLVSEAGEREFVGDYPAVRNQLGLERHEIPRVLSMPQPMQGGGIATDRDRSLFNEALADEAQQEAIEAAFAKEAGQDAIVDNYWRRIKERREWDDLSFSEKLATERFKGSFPGRTLQGLKGLLGLEEGQAQRPPWGAEGLVPVPTMQGGGIATDEEILMEAFPEMRPDAPSDDEIMAELLGGGGPEQGPPSDDEILTELLGSGDPQEEENAMLKQLLKEKEPASLLDILHSGLKDVIINSIDDPNRQGKNSFVPAMLKAYDEINKLGSGGVQRLQGGAYAAQLPRFAGGVSATDQTKQQWNTGMEEERKIDPTRQNNMAASYGLVNTGGGSRAGDQHKGWKSLMGLGDTFTGAPGHGTIQPRANPTVPTDPTVPTAAGAQNQQSGYRGIMQGMMDTLYGPRSLKGQTGMVNRAGQWDDRGTREMTGAMSDFALQQAASDRADYQSNVGGWQAQDASDRAWAGLDLGAEQARGPGVWQNMANLGMSYLANRNT